MGFPHHCDSACEEDHNYEARNTCDRCGKVEECAEDCDCDYCHEEWHNPVSDWAICERCKEIQTEGVAQ